MRVTLSYVSTLPWREATFHITDPAVLNAIWRHMERYLALRCLPTSLIFNSRS